MKRRKQGYNDRLDESLGMRRGPERKYHQSMKDRRDQSKGMEKHSGDRVYSTMHDMDEGDREKLNHHVMAAHHKFMQHHHGTKLRKK